MSSADDFIMPHVHSGEFEIDDNGRIWRTRDHRGPIVRRRGEKRTPRGYLMVRKMVNGKRRAALAHRLVWIRANGPIPDGMTINHKNGRKDDNRLQNLEVVTYSENMRHAHRTRLLDQRGGGNPAGRLTDDEVRRIRERRADGESLTGIAHDFGIAFQTVSKIAKGRTRVEAGGPITGTDGRTDGWRSLERDKDSGQFVGKKTAGRLLDGRTWDEMPEVTRG